MSLLDFWQLLRRFWWVVALALAVSVGSTALSSTKQTPEYRASTTIILAPHDRFTINPSEFRNNLETLDNRAIMATFAAIPESQTVRTRAREQLGLPLEEVDSYRVNTAVIPDTSILRVTVVGPDPQVAASVANATAEQTKTFILEFYRIFTAKVLDPATPPSRSAGLDIRRNLLVSFVLGAVLGVALLFGVEVVRRSRAALGEREKGKPTGGA